MTYPSLLILIILVIGSSCFQQYHTENGVMAYYEKYSFKPIIHVYYNHHFKNSTKFKLFQNTLNQLYTDHHDYLEILFTDCDLDQQRKLKICERMRKTKDNRQITGTAPANDFKRVGNFIIQSPPMTQNINQHAQDVYHYDQLKNLILGILPNFYKEINNIEQYEDFLNPRYAPKLIVFAQDRDQIPIVMRYIAVAFFLKVDLAYVSDLTEDITKQFKLKKSQASFVIVKYNFNQSKYQNYYYSGSELTEPNFGKIKQFVGKYALPTQRNDLLFHKITMETSSQIATLQTEGQLEQYKQKANGWVLIVHSQGQVSPKLFSLYQKYGRYFSYVNYVHEPIDKAQIYNPTQKATYIMENNQLKFNSLNFEDFKSNMTVWLTKDLIVLGISPDYPHICGLAEKTLFRGHVRCLIISQQGKKQLQQFMKIDFEIGFIARTQYSDRKTGNRQTKGMKIMKDDFQLIYKDLDYTTRVKLKQQLDFYLQNPVSQIKQSIPLSQICFHPFKKCLFLVTNLAKQDRTLQQYLKEEAFDYINNFIIFEIDMDSNPEFVQAIGGVKDKKADIVVYNPNTQQFVKLNKKITKNLMSQFFRANLKNDKRLKKIKSQKLGQIIIKSIKKAQDKPNKNRNSEEEDSQWEEQL